MAFLTVPFPLQRTVVNLKQSTKQAVRERATENKVAFEIVCVFFEWVVSYDLQLKFEPCWWRCNLSDCLTILSSWCT